MENFQNDQLTNMGLQVDAEVRQNLNDASRWTRFISIVMFVACGLILLFGVAAGAQLTNTFRRLGGVYDVLGGFDSYIFIIIIVVVVAIMAGIYYFLFDFSRKIKTGLLSESTTEFNSALKSLRTFFIITTVFAVLGLLMNTFNLFN